MAVEAVDVSEDGAILCERIGRIARKVGGRISPQTLRAVAVEHEIPLRRQGSLVYCPVAYIPHLIQLGKDHIRKDERIFGKRDPVSHVKMLAPRVVHVTSKAKPEEG